ARVQHVAGFRRGQPLLSLMLPVMLHISLGGIVSASLVAIWSIMAFLMAVLFANTRESTLWFLAFVVLVAGAMIARPSLTIDNNLPPSVVIGFFVMNLMAVSSIGYAILLADRKSVV